MQKAHLYEAILLVNQGDDDAVRGLERLKRAKDSGLKPSYFDEKRHSSKYIALRSTGISATTLRVVRIGTQFALKRGTANTRRTTWTKCKSIKT